MSEHLAQQPQKRAAARSAAARPAQHYDQAEGYARTLEFAIARELPEVEAFAREDLLHLKAFSAVATITRYRYVCEGIARLIEEGKVVPKGRTMLVLARKERAFDRATQGLPLWERYYDKITRLMDEMQDSWSVMDVVGAWGAADQHLTTNSKRVAVRDAVRQAIRDQIIEKVDAFTYRTLAR